MQPTIPMTLSKTERLDRSKWNVLKEVDPDIAKAAAEVNALSPAYENKLAEKFLTLSDKSYLPTLVENIKTEHTQKEVAKVAAIANAEVEMDERKKAARQAREQRAKETMAEIERDGMLSKRDRKQVRSIDMYYGRDLDLHGHVKLIFSDLKLRSVQNTISISSINISN